VSVSPWSRFRSSIQETTKKTLAAAFGWSFMAPESVFVSCGTLRRIPLDLAIVKRCIPLVCSSDRAVLLVDDPMNGLYLVTHPELLGAPYRREIEIVLTESRLIDRLLEKRRCVVRR